MCYITAEENYTIHAFGISNVEWDLYKSLIKNTDYQLVISVKTAANKASEMVVMHFRLT